MPGPKVPPVKLKPETRDLMAAVSGRVFKRDLPVTLNRELKVDPESGVVQLAFSSEQPVLRYDWWEDQVYWEVLSHEKADMDLSRLNAEAPFLIDHSRRSDDQIGIIVENSVQVGSDRVGRADVRFGPSERAQVYRKDVDAGIRKKTSVGYEIIGMRQDGEVDGIPLMRVQWRPQEISLVTIPADDTVGVGRSADEPKPKQEPAPQAQRSQKNMNEEEKKAAEEKARREKEEKEALDERARVLAEEHFERETSRQNGLRSIFKAVKRNEPDLPEKLLDEALAKRDITADQFSRQVSDWQEEAHKNDTPVTQLDLSKKDQERFSMRNAYGIMAGWGKRDSLEGECTKELRDRVSSLALVPKMQEALNDCVLIPYDVQSRDFKADGAVAKAMRERREERLADLHPKFGERAQTVGTATAGGNLVGTTNLASSFIEFLYDSNPLSGLPLMRMPGLRGNVTIPRQSGKATVGWVTPEGSDAAETALTFAQISLSPKVCGAYVDMTLLAQLQTEPAIEPLVTSDLAMSLGLERGRVILRGAGTGGEPTGVVNQSGIHTVSGTSYDYADLWEHVTDLGGSNVGVDALVGLLPWAMLGLLATRVRVSGAAAGFLLENFRANGIGFPVIPTNLCSAATFTVGNWRQVIEASWGVLMLTRDTYTLSKSGGTRVVALDAMDVNMRHVEAVSHASSIT